LLNNKKIRAKNSNKNFHIMLICGVYFILNKEDFSFLEMNIVWVYSLALKDKKNKNLKKDNKKKIE
jgi:hypothetical protein